MTVDKGLALLQADFNSARDGATIVGRFEWNGSALLPNTGDSVKLRDVDGNECDGVIVGMIDNDFFRVHVDWDSWSDAEERNQITGQLADVVDMMAELRKRVTDLQEGPNGDVSATRGKIWKPVSAG